jgi:hypothetical protein
MKSSLDDISDYRKPTVYNISTAISEVFMGSELLNFGATGKGLLQNAFGTDPIVDKIVMSYITGSFILTTILGHSESARNKFANGLDRISNFMKSKKPKVITMASLLSPVYSNLTDEENEQHIPELETTNFEDDLLNVTTPDPDLINQAMCEYITESNLTQLEE